MTREEKIGLVMMLGAIFGMQFLTLCLVLAGK